MRTSGLSAFGGFSVLLRRNRIGNASGARCLGLMGCLAALVMASEAGAGALFSRSFAAGDNPISVAVADLNGDGVPDLVTANSTGGGELNVLLGNGDGTFQAAVSFAPGISPWSVAVADINGDSVPDLVTANPFNHNHNDVSVLLGNGDGSFQTPIFFMAGDRTFFVAVADLDGDNRPDLVTANVNSDDVSVLINLPEPTSWLMLGTGIGFLGLLYRRRARGLRFC